MHTEVLRETNAKMVTYRYRNIILNWNKIATAWIGCTPFKTANGWFRPSDCGAASS